MRRQLQTLRFSARQSRHRLAQRQITETHRGERLERFDDFLVFGKEGNCLIDGHIQHIGDRLSGLAAFAEDLHFQQFRAVTATLTFRAAQVDVAEKLHLDMFKAIAAASGALHAGVKTE